MQVGQKVRVSEKLLAVGAKVPAYTSRAGEVGWGVEVQEHLDLPFRVEFSDGFGFWLRGDELEEVKE